MTLDVDAVRRRFPALSRTLDGRPVVFFDGPAGAQVPVEVGDAVRRYLLETNANKGGVFATAHESDAVLDEARRATADLLGASDPDEVIFGANMTSLTVALSHAIGPTLPPGSRVLVTRLDHDANITPWERMAARHGLAIEHVDVVPEDGTLDLEDLERRLAPGAALLAVTAASNALGTMPPIAEICAKAHRAGARVFVDAVHYAAHAPVDVEAWGCDFLACSAYKFFGTHVGVLWGRREALEALDPDQVRPAPRAIPGRWMTGTQSHEGIAGVGAAIDYLASLGEGADRRARLLDAFARIVAHERTLAADLLEGLAAVPDVRVLGITDPERLAERAPTVSFTHARATPEELCERLASEGIFTWAGHMYALTLSERLGLEPDGMLRVGPLHYNTRAEVRRLLEVVRAV